MVARAGKIIEMRHHNFLIIVCLAVQLMFMILAKGISNEHGQQKIQQQQQDSKGCPLTSLSLLNYDSDCFTGVLGMASVELYNWKMPLCCLQVFAGLSKLMATYTNSSNTLFLTRPQEEACFGELANVSVCTGVASKFVAGNSPCAFASPEILRESLISADKDDQAVSFDRILEECGPSNAEMECSVCASAFTGAVHLLNTSLQDDSIVCAAALFVSLASTSPNNPAWSNSLYGCAQQQLSIHLAAAGTHKSSWTIIIIIVVVLGALGAIIVLTIFAMILRKKRKKLHGDFNRVAMQTGTIYQDYAYDDDSITYIHSGGLYTFSVEEIAKATNDFSEDNVLGKGSAGKVFKGVLPSGQFVAVKQIDKDTKPHTFKAELVNLSKVRHANLVTLMGFCQSNDAYYLVYEYCANGDLSKWLFLAEDDENILSWEQRVRIAVSSARGLWFLHYYPGGSIVHRDIKPTNILLNERLEAKLSDFGLARYMEIEEYSHVLTEVQGTTGYVDPQYMSMGELTLSSDVYSFGVVLLQLISARRAIDLDPLNRLSLVKTAKLIAETGEDLRDFADPRLEGCYSSLAMLKMFRVAIACISSSRYDRLTMKEVLQNLEDVSELSFHTIPYSPMDQDESINVSPKSLQAISGDSQT